VITRRCRNVLAARAREYVLGYAGLNDVVARDIQTRDGDWTRAKAFDPDLDPSTATIETWVHGTRRATGSTKELGYGMEDVLAASAR
jgi:2-keto-4-pentenoate hydratase/2-oxohepta-3-ene-1,7-dioic acid hydratase in catechol pathway